MLSSLFCLALVANCVTDGVSTTMPCMDTAWPVVCHRRPLLLRLQAVDSAVLSFVPDFPPLAPHDLYLPWIWIPCFLLMLMTYHHLLAHHLNDCRLPSLLVLLLFLFCFGLLHVNEPLQHLLRFLGVQMVNSVIFCHYVA